MKRLLIFSSPCSSHLGRRSRSRKPSPSDFGAFVRRSHSDSIVSMSLKATSEMLPISEWLSTPKRHFNSWGIWGLISELDRRALSLIKIFYHSITGSNLYI